MCADRRLAILGLGDDTRLLVDSYSGRVFVTDRRMAKVIEKWVRTGKTSSARECVQVLQSLSTPDNLLGPSLTREEMLIHMKRSCFLEKCNSEKCKIHIVIPTYDCNLRCSYCYEKYLYQKGLKWLKTKIDVEKIDAIFDLIVKLDSNCLVDQRNTIQLYGGEPLQLENIELIRYILQKGSRLGYRFFIATNGVALKDYISTLKEFSVVGLQITLDGVAKTHDARRRKPDHSGSFEDIVKGVNTAREAGLRINLRINVDAENFEQLPELLKFFYSQEWHLDPKIRPYLRNVTSVPAKIPHFVLADAISEIITWPLDSALKRWFLMGVFATSIPYFVEAFAGKRTRIPAKFWYCGANSAGIIYDPHGDLYPCESIIGNEEHKIGTYFPYFEIFKSPYAMWRNRTVFNIPKCRKCDYAYLCGGGCAHKAYQCTNSFVAPYCEDFLDNLRLLPIAYEYCKEQGMINEPERILTVSKRI